MTSDQCHRPGNWGTSEKQRTALLNLRTLTSQCHETQTKRCRKVVVTLEKAEWFHTTWGSCCGKVQTKGALADLAAWTRVSSSARALAQRVCPEIFSWLLWKGNAWTAVKRTDKGCDEYQLAVCDLTCLMVTHSDPAETQSGNTCTSCELRCSHLNQKIPVKISLRLCNRKHLLRGLHICFCSTCNLHWQQMFLSPFFRKHLPQRKVSMIWKWADRVSLIVECTCWLYLVKRIKTQVGAAKPGGRRFMPKLCEGAWLHSRTTGDNSRCSTW